MCIAPTDLPIRAGGRRPRRTAARRRAVGICRAAWRGLTARLRRPARLHRDERGTISLLTVVTIIGLMLVLGMVINVGRHIDDKVKMQNAADAATYSGGVVLARGMNALAFSNHLLCDVFAMTAFMREARDRNAEAMVPDILAAWTNAGKALSKSGLPELEKVGRAIVNKAPLEQNLVSSYSELSAATSQLVLPVLEHVLRERLIPEFQRAVVRTIPEVAQQATNEVARRHGLKQPKRRQIAVLWRTSAEPVGVADEGIPQSRTLPAIDPEPGSADYPEAVPDPHPDPRAGGDFRSIPGAAEYLRRAVRQREFFAHGYLDRFRGGYPFPEPTPIPYSGPAPAIASDGRPGSWNEDRLRFFQREARMSQFFNLWGIFTCGQLDQLLKEYAFSNLPHVIRFTGQGLDPDLLVLRPEETSVRTYLDTQFTFLGVVYRPQFDETFPGFFRNPMASDPLTFAQVRLFIPAPRMVPLSTAGASQPEGDMNVGGSIGSNVSLPQQPIDPAQQGNGAHPQDLTNDWVYEAWSRHWDLLNQNWTVQIVPVSTRNLVQILQQRPEQVLRDPLVVRLPNLGGADNRTLGNLNSH